MIKFTKQNWEATVNEDIDKALGEDTGESCSVGMLACDCCFTKQEWETGQIMLFEKGAYLALYLSGKIVLAGVTFYGTGESLVDTGATTKGIKTL